MSYNFPENRDKCRTKRPYAGISRWANGPIGQNQNIFLIFGCKKYKPVSQIAQTIDNVRGCQIYIDGLRQKRWNTSQKYGNGHLSLTRGFWQTMTNIEPMLLPPSFLESLVQDLARHQG